MHFIKKNRTVRFYKILLSYVLILATALAIVYPLIINRYLNDLKQDEAERCSAALMEAGKALDSRFTEFKAIASRIGFSSVLSSTRLKNGVSSHMEAIRELQSYINVNDFIAKAAIFYPDSDLVITNEYKYDYSSYFDFCSFDGWDASTVSSLISDKVFGKMLPLSSSTLLVIANAKRIMTDDHSFLCIFYLVPTAGQNTLLCLFIDEAQLISSACAALGGAEGRFVMTDADGTILFDYQTCDSAISSTVYEYSSLAIGFTLTISIAQSATAAQMEDARMAVSLALVLLVVIGLVLSIILSSIHYRPLRIVAGKLHATGKDEIEQLSNGVDEMLKSNAEMSHSLRSVHISELLIGNYDTLQAYTDLGFDSCGILMLSVDDIREFRSMYSAEQRSLIRISICDILESAAAEYARGIAVPMPEGHSCAMIAEANSIGVMKQIANKAYEAFCGAYNFKATIGISRVSESITDAHQHYLEACAALKQRFASGGGMIYVYEELDHSEITGSRFTKSVENSFTASIRTGDAEKAMNIALETLNSIKEAGAGEEETALMVLEISNSCLQLQNELNIPVKPQQMQLLRLLRSEQCTFDQTRELLSELIESLAADFSLKRENLQAKRLSSITDIVHEHYRDSTFCLNDIASKLGLSPSYTTQIFREMTGETLMNYVDELRMKDALTLIETTSLPIKDIVSLVGYTDQTNFIRKFKTLKGVTPSVYRKGFNNNSTD